VFCFNKCPLESENISANIFVWLSHSLYIKQYLFIQLRICIPTYMSLSLPFYVQLSLHLALGCYLGISAVFVSPLYTATVHTYIYFSCSLPIYLYLPRFLCISLRYSPPPLSSYLFLSPSLSSFPYFALTPSDPQYYVSLPI
jgi:hypothetical protein